MALGHAVQLIIPHGLGHTGMTCWAPGPFRPTLHELLRGIAVSDHMRRTPHGRLQHILLPETASRGQPTSEGIPQKSHIPNHVICHSHLLTVLLSFSAHSNLGCFAPPAYHINLNPSNITSVAPHGVFCEAYHQPNSTLASFPFRRLSIHLSAQTRT